MTKQLSKELADTLDSSGQEELNVDHPTTNRLYVVVDDQVHRKAMAALCRPEDHDAIAEGIAQMEAGLGKPLRELEAEMWKHPPDPGPSKHRSRNYCRIVVDRSAIKT